tara:strand:+ start:256 stop:435 length:180 start_codon:yes stop_codon:yes gene_type:complete
MATNSDPIDVDITRFGGFRCSAALGTWLRIEAPRVLKKSSSEYIKDLIKADMLKRGFEI